MLNCVAYTKNYHEILCLMQHAQYPCRWIGRSEPVLRLARNNDLTPHILCAERVDHLPSLSRGSEVAFAAVPTTLLCGRSLTQSWRLLGLFELCRLIKYIVMKFRVVVLKCFDSFWTRKCCVGLNRTSVLVYFVTGISCLSCPRSCVKNM